MLIAANKIGYEMEGPCTIGHYSNIYWKFIPDDEWPLVVRKEKVSFLEFLKKKWVDAWFNG